MPEIRFFPSFYLSHFRFTRHPFRDSARLRPPNCLTSNQLGSLTTIKSRRWTKNTTTKTVWLADFSCIIYFVYVYSEQASPKLSSMVQAVDAQYSKIQHIYHQTETRLFILINVVNVLFVHSFCFYCHANKMPHLVSNIIYSVYIIHLFFHLLNSYSYCKLWRMMFRKWITRWQPWWKFKKKETKTYLVSCNRN